MISKSIYKFDRWLYGDGISIIAKADLVRRAAPDTDKGIEEEPTIATEDLETEL
jgi:hypothetical protein